MKEELVSTKSEWYDLYGKTLRTNIENKKYFLKKARDAISELKAAAATAEQDGAELSKTKKNKEEVWNRFLSKSMLFPERSDPIGLSLASLSQSMRMESSKDAINVMKGNTQNLDSMLIYQKQLNDNIETLIKSLDNNANGDDDDQGQVRHSQVQTHAMDWDTSTAMKNKELWESLNKFVTEALFSNDPYANVLTKDIVSQVLKKLINYDPTLTLEDFKEDKQGNGALMRLYRLLLKSNLIICEGDSNISPRDRRVQLIDFIDSDLS
ncbi:Mcm22p NDAI_0J02930 [Naumovozyma dairenensis CBS 421]|uniref:Uncharacterized protein n=1 Tax=Naumovozyma dairenensis (strain ATCC 10597 / BCRC 20456 / CBS 421 / NBRC 0211 / NRRL Y-12639) TaxID=1071378 RepID=G0WHA7_NAUDC|nr:hypothetical protein NDAI_0J02930 [Naumovozyma dairenensis CBS 421]CCD27185.1 hypothetical protein NDAI_0J02930 [Naumovozyma dairenensis CBS 421]